MKTCGNLERGKIYIIWNGLIPVLTRLPSQWHTQVTFIFPRHFSPSVSTSSSILFSCQSSALSVPLKSRRASGPSRLADLSKSLLPLPWSIEHTHTHFTYTLKDKRRHTLYVPHTHTPVILSPINLHPLFLLFLNSLGFRLCGVKVKCVCCHCRYVHALSVSLTHTHVQVL